MWPPRLFGVGRDDVEADEREEHERGAAEDPADAKRPGGCAEVLKQPDLPDDPRLANISERVRNRPLTDKIVADVFGSLNRDELIARLDDADIAFGEVNTMSDLTVHPHLRRIEVDTPKGVVTYSAPAPIFVGEPRTYGPVPAIDEHTALEAPRARKSS